MYGRVSPAIKPESESTPAPGEYEVTRYRSTKSYRMGGHVASPGDMAKRDLEHLGPGAYNVSGVKGTVGTGVKYRCAKNEMNDGDKIIRRCSVKGKTRDGARKSSGGEIELSSGREA
eukprot:8750623-Pyramimonas_sp.AAC.1